MNPTLLSDIFNFSNTADFEKGLKLIRDLPKVYEKSINDSVKHLKKLQEAEKKNIAIAENWKKTLGGLDASLKKDHDQIEKIVKASGTLSQVQGEVKKNIDSTTKAVDKLTKEQEDFNKSSTKTTKLSADYIKLQNKLIKANSDEEKGIAKLKLQIQEKNKALKQSARESLNMVTLYEKESKRLIELRKRYKDVALAEGETSKKSRDLRKEISALDARIKSVDKSAGQFQRNVGNYPSKFAASANAAKQLAGALGFTGVIFALVGAFKSAFNVIRNFQKESAVLAGVLNTTRDNVSALRDDATRLGSTTAKTATEVTELQIAYARLGFSQEEIIDLTEDTISGSIALNAQLDETAELTGAIIRTFEDLSTTDADLVLDQMTVATQKSALSFEKLQTTIPIVSGAANAAGIPFTRLLALLGKLSDSGIDASSSATALRNIFIESASKGLNYEQILNKIASSQDKLTAANDEFGKRSAVSGTILANLTDEVGQLDVALQKAGGTAERVANEQLNTLEGKLTLASSAIEGMVLAIENGDGALSSFMSSMVEDFTEYITIITAAENGTIGWGEALSAFSSQTNKIGIVNKIAAKEIGKKILADQLAAKAAEVHGQLVEKNIKTFEEFKETKIARYYENIANGQQLMTLISKEYTKASEEQVKIEKQKADALLNVSDSMMSLDDFSEYYQKFSKVVQDGGDEIKFGFKSIGDEISSTIPESLEKLETNTESSLSKTKVLWRKWSEEISKAALVAFDMISIGVNQLFTNQSINRENSLAEFENQQEIEIEKLEERRERETSIEGLSAASKKAINSKYNSQIQALEDQTAEKQKQIRKKQAESEKKQAIFNTILNTAAAIVEALPNVPLAIAVGVIGATSLAAIASQPIPAYAQGTGSEGHPGGSAIVGDGGGREMIIEPSGRVYFSDDKPHMVDMPRGSHVLNHVVTESIMSNSKSVPKTVNDVVGLRDTRKHDYLAEKLIKNHQSESDYMVKGFESAMNKIEVQQFRFSRFGLAKDRKRGNTIHRDVEQENKW